ncbi:S-layer protein domain-containing protein [Methanococcoides sp. AM1]|uniref:S-layer protein domain-containing protein n=1 Tax=Methanococcoides sp. AM1 TaxID=1201011 RepID=UPI001083DBC8|nr:S-layer protein domain-containing protein [Methanococcoides sp. AM1]
MKYIYFVLLAIFVMLFAATPAASLDPSEPIIHYSDSVVERDTKLSLAQGYTLEIVDINEDNGDVWVEIRHNGKLVEDGEGSGKENDPFEYILTIEAEDDDDEDEEYLIFRVTPKELVTSGTDTATKIRIEQFRDPTRDTKDFLIYDRSDSVNIGDEMELEEGYTLSASDLDVDEETITVTLKKNEHVVKEVKEMEPGDVFSYYKNVDGEVRTIFIANVYDFFESSETHILFLKEISQREDVNIESTVEISIQGLSGNVIKDGEKAIIAYELDKDASKVTISLDDDIIDARNDVDAGTYQTLTDELDRGTHDVIIETVSTDGSVSSKETSFTVDGASSTGDTASEDNMSVQDQVEDIIKDGENAGSEVSDSVEDITKSTAFTYIVVAALLALTAFFFKREFS